MSKKFIKQPKNDEMTEQASKAIDRAVEALLALKKGYYSDEEAYTTTTVEKVNLAKMPRHIAAGLAISINLTDFDNSIPIILEPRAIVNFRKKLPDGSWIMAKACAGEEEVIVNLAALSFSPVEDFFN